MNREKGITISYSQMLDYWEEESESIIYDNLDRIKYWFKKIFKK